ncbi:hypothetical protein ACFL0V_03025 [Nanoarchaeota archaeon]
MRKMRVRELFDILREEEPYIPRRLREIDHEFLPSMTFEDLMEEMEPHMDEVYIAVIVPKAVDKVVFQLYSGRPELSDSGHLSYTSPFLVCGSAYEPGQLKSSRVSRRLADMPDSACEQLEGVRGDLESIQVYRLK